MKKIAITMGDPAGIGAEAILKAFFPARDIPDPCIPIIIGDRVVMEEAARLLHLSLDLHIIKTPGEAKLAPGSIDMIDMAELNVFARGRPTAEG